MRDPIEFLKSLFNVSTECTKTWDTCEECKERKEVINYVCVDEEGVYVLIVCEDCDPEAWDIYLYDQWK